MTTFNLEYWYGVNETTTLSLEDDHITTTLPPEITMIPIADHICEIDHGTDDGDSDDDDDNHEDDDDHEEADDDDHYYSAGKSYHFFHISFQVT